MSFVIWGVIPVVGIKSDADTRLNVTERVTHFRDNQSVLALTLSEPPHNVKISKRLSDIVNQRTF